MERRPDVYYCETCPEHIHNNYLPFAIWIRFGLCNSNQKVLKQAMEKCLQDFGTLPCFLLDQIGTDKDLIALCKKYGITCCKQERSNLSRMLLGLPLVDKSNEYIKNIFDRNVQLGRKDKVRYLIQKNRCRSDNIAMYDNDKILQFYLISELFKCRILRHYSECVASIVATFVPWSQMRRLFL